MLFSVELGFPVRKVVGHKKDLGEIAGNQVSGRRKTDENGVKGGKLSAKKARYVLVTSQAIRCTVPT